MTATSRTQPVSKTRQLVVMLAVCGITSAALATPAAAEPDDPCAHTMVFFCRMLPMAPELDHDIDLTQPTPPAPPPAASLAPATEPCLLECR